MVYFFTVLFGVLVYWLLGFFTRDIGTWPGPVYAEVEAQLADSDLMEETDDLKARISDTKRAIQNREQRQKVLRDSTSNSERTMNQLLGLQRLTLQQGLSPSTEEIAALASSQQLFLENQAKYQEMNDQIATFNEELREREDRQREVNELLATGRPAIQEEFNRLRSGHQLRLAALKLAVLLPLLGIAVWLFLKRRDSVYAWLIYGFGLALLLKVVVVMHEYFPSRYFKYVLIVFAIALVARILVYLLRSMAYPKLDWLLKQYREAYERFLCPVCSHPIRRGPLKHLFWTRSSLKKLHVPANAGEDDDEPYTCPACTTVLFEECSECKHTRHSLLPACSHCGDIKELKLTTTRSNT